MAIARAATDLVESARPGHAPRASHGRAATLIVLLPRQYRPLKANFAKRFENFAGAFSGYIFAISGDRYRGLRIGDFLLYSESETASAGGVVGRALRRLWLQAVLPLTVVRKAARVDAIVSYDPYASGLAGSLLKTLLGARLILEVNGDFHQAEPSRHVVKRWVMRLAFAISVRCADAVKVLNRHQENYFRQRYPSKKVFRFPNFVADEYFQSLESYQGDYLLSVGYPYDLKGMDVLIRAFRLIAGRHPGMKLKIMGHCPTAELVRYKALAQDQPAVEFVGAGWIEEVGEMMRGCYALVNAARSEALGRIHLEAMACQKPIVATRTNGAMECVEDGVTGLLCEIDNPDDLAAKLDCLLANPRLSQRMGRAGFERLQRNYSETIYTRSFVSMIEELLSPGAREDAAGRRQP